MPSYPELNKIGSGETTWGTETSKYPKEEKSTEIAGVAASETAPAQTHACVSVRALLHEGLWDQSFYEPYLIDAVINLRVSKTAWEGRRHRVKAPYAKTRRLRDWHPSSAGHVKPGANLGGPPSKAKYSFVTDSEPVP